MRGIMMLTFFEIFKDFVRVVLVGIILRWISFDFNVLGQLVQNLLLWVTLLLLRNFLSLGLGSINRVFKNN